MKAQLFSKSEVRGTIAKTIEGGAVFEVRALDAQLYGNRRTGTVSGYFDNADACLAELEKLTTAKGVYFTLNPVNAALLARRANRLDYAEKNATTNDQHILQCRWLLLDVDADRPSGISASDSEKKAAHKKALEIYEYLKGRGWPLPMAADSGNGYHLLYRIDLPCNDGKVLEQVLTALADRFDGDGVKLDRSVHNQARIARLYGTLAAKGDNTKERPQRLSKILKAPESLEVASAEKLRALVDELKPADPPQGERRAAHNAWFDVDAFLTRYGIAVAERIIEADGTIKRRLERCPFNPDHETPDAAVFQMPDGKLGFRCLHNSCTGKHWKDFRRHFEPEKIKNKTTGENDDEGEKPASKSAATRLVEFTEAFTFFHDRQDRPFVRLEINAHTEIWPVESTRFRKLLARTYYQQTKKAINRNALSDAVTTLAGKACHDGNEEAVLLRVAPHDENILIDLCDDGWRVVEVTPDGWRILDKSPVAFIRTGSMQSLPEPVQGGGSIAPLWKLLNVTEAQRPLVAGGLLNAFHPDGPYYVVNYVGEQGTAKTCMARIHRQLVDPNENPLRSPPKEERDLLAQAASNRCVALDNLSSLPAWQSDAICRLSTGGGHSARELYTDLEEISLAVKRPVILNGIEDVATRPDLAERCLQIELETIPEEKRISEKDLWRRFDKHWPVIFSGILDALVCALREQPKIKLDSLPRMADAALWATAGEISFGWRRGTFMQAYRRNLDEGAIASVEAHPVGVAIRQLLEIQNQWSGTPAQLLETLNALVSEEEQRRARTWPSNTRALGHCLRRLAPALRRAGIDYQRPPREADRRIIQMCRVADKTSQTSSSSCAPPENDVCDDPDDLSPSLHVPTKEAGESGKKPMVI
jgi:hypothetical protein